MLLNLLVLTFIAVLNSINAQIDQDCLNCICQIESDCNDIGCSMDVGSLSCGYYQIKYDYWVDCGKPGNSWKQCASDKNCAERCVQNYAAKYGKYCTGGVKPRCQDYARIHNGGPKGCLRSNTLGYWNKINSCLGY